MSELESAVRLAEIARSLAIPVTAFGDPPSCDLGQTAELLRLWQSIDDPCLRARMLASARGMAGRCGSRANRAEEQEPDPAA